MSVQKEFTHLDKSGNPSMVDVGAKRITKRVAVARSIVVLDEEILLHFEDDDIRTKKGSVFQTAILYHLAKALIATPPD